MNANVAQSFNFLPVPTDIHFGCGILRDLPDRLRALDAARPFLITDPGVAAAGIMDRAAKILQTAQCEFELFDGVKADSGSKALERLLERQFAVVLLDVGMPDIDGFEVAKLMRRHPRYGRTPIIFVTAADASELDLVKGYGLGAIDYLSMPIAPEVLRSKVAVLVELHERRAELEVVNSQLEAARAQLEAQHEQALAERDAHLNAVFEHPSQLILVLEAMRNEAGAVVDCVYRNANHNAKTFIARSRQAP